MNPARAKGRPPAILAQQTGVGNCQVPHPRLRDLYRFGLWILDCRLYVSPSIHSVRRGARVHPSRSRYSGLRRIKASTYQQRGTTVRPDSRA